VVNLALVYPHSVRIWECRLYKSVASRCAGVHERGNSFTGGSGAASDIDAPPDPSTVHRQMNALLLLDDGWAAERVAAVLFIDAHGSSQPGLDPQGSDRELKSNHGRVNVNINGALSWLDRAVVHREAARITRAEMILLFNDLQARHPTQTAINVVLDNARYNHSAEIKAYLACDECRIKLVYLPAYAPI
jgi:hypothetical protein